jgi:hypothetical protein
MSFAGPAIWGAIWTLDDWKEGGLPPLAEVKAADDTYSSGTFGLYQGSSETLFDDVVVSVEGQSSNGPLEPLLADVEFDPATLNLRSSARFLTCFVELPVGHDPWEIDVSTVLLNHALPAELSPTGVSDFDNDSVSDRMIKFDRDEVIVITGASSGSNTSESGGLSFSLPTSGDEEVELDVTGALHDGTEFSGTGGIVMTNAKGGGTDRPVLRMPRGPLGIKAMIGFDLSVAGPVSLCVYDAAGRHVRTLASGHKGAGSHNVTWDRRTDDGRSVGPGVYFVRLEQGSETSVGKMILVN